MYWSGHALLMSLQMIFISHYCYSALIWTPIHCSLTGKWYSSFVLQSMCSTRPSLKCDCLVRREWVWTWCRNVVRGRAGNDSEDGVDNIYLAHQIESMFAEIMIMSLHFTRTWKQSTTACTQRCAVGLRKIFHRGKFTGNLPHVMSSRDFQAGIFWTSKRFWRYACM